ncbi:hypothetical protein [Tenacibaculum maritimum]|uniref:hypothetical protein n=1 Tax=Tenacibaculum maritimum TaxID=107401 RepID=UPI002307DB88|nr:hypothetical protein [Tenacibaculum maritimum]MDB0600073.1 hypothetical protein [Tenacibaculum maritimum]MDB0611172.1 hypothetical protein [Tenacibaculum maritimum]
MFKQSNIKCSECGVFTANNDYCKNCGALISYEKKRALREKAVEEERVYEALEALEKPNLPERLKKHPIFLMQIIGWILHSVFLIVNIIGLGLAWFIAMVAAG